MQNPQIKQLLYLQKPLWPLKLRNRPKISIPNPQQKFTKTQGIFTKRIKAITSSILVSEAKISWISSHRTKEKLRIGRFNIFVRPINCVKNACTCSVESSAWSIVIEQLYQLTIFAGGINSTLVPLRLRSGFSPSGSCSRFYFLFFLTQEMNKYREGGRVIGFSNGLINLNWNWDGSTYAEMCFNLTLMDLGSPGRSEGYIHCFTRFWAGCNTT